MDLSYLRQQIIGAQVEFDSPYGKRMMTYADFTASGRSILFIEAYLQKLEEFYANTHTDDSYAGLQMTHLYHEAKDTIRSLCHGNQDYVVLSVGSGTTGAIQKLSQILGVYEAPATKNRRKLLEQQVSESSPEAQRCIEKLNQLGQSSRPVVFISSYEHHSNDLIWREGDADVVQIGLTEEGHFSLEDLETQVKNPKYQGRLLIGAFSAASNVTGMLSPIYDIARIMHTYGGLAFFDFAACGPYVEINLTKSELEAFDGIYLSPHKMIGGPGTSGLLVFHKSIYNKALSPTCAGGGTVQYVSSKFYDFISDIEIREDAGTPAILQVIKTALALLLKEEIGIPTIEDIERDYIQQALKRFEQDSNIYILGPTGLRERLSIFSFNIKYKEGYLHPRFVTKLLNDLFGIQARAGCSCAGPYGHQLLKIDPILSEKYRGIISTGLEVMKPGWVRVNFHYLFESKSTLQFIFDAIEFIGKYGYLFLQDYSVDVQTGKWEHKNQNVHTLRSLNLHEAMSPEKNLMSPYDEAKNQGRYEAYWSFANQRKDLLMVEAATYELFGEVDLKELAWFYQLKK
ncbi:MAG: aminotransferase class V-fold PLP-dependent enzyme [Vallitaleaceae bacterium]|nr:aminotransferase class V-fold PLP-dependent enzyme [Vallitaleaceae bacterium]